MSIRVLVLACLFTLTTIACGGDDTTGPEVCDDGADNDGDGDTDCADSECASACEAALVARDDEATTDEDLALALDAATLLGNDEGPGTLAITAVGSAIGGTVALDGTTITFTPAAELSGAASFVYTVEAGDATATATVRVSVTWVDDAPVAVDDEAAMREDTVRVFGGDDLLGNDLDPDSADLSVTAAAGAVNGTVSFAGGNATFAPTANFTGEASFTYTVSDGTSTDTGTVTITVIGEDDPFVLAHDAATTAEDNAVTMTAATLLGNDSDPDGVLTLTSVQDAVNGTVALAGTDVTFTPDADFNGAASFTYTASDGTTSGAATVAVTVTPVDDAPIAVDDVATVDEDRILVIQLATLLGNDVDIDDDETITSVQDAVNGTVAMIGTEVEFEPPPDFAGIASFTYTLTGGALTDTATVTITVNEVVECPDGGPDSGEECDDGNSVAGDGCENDCTFTCASGSGADRVAVVSATGHCYAVFDGMAATWSEGEEFCGALAGYLPVVADAAENTLLAGLSVTGDNPWLGATDSVAEGTFVWVNGEPFSFQPWATDQPDNGAGVSQEDCVHLWQDAPGGSGWNDSNCDFSGFVTGLVCEIDPVCGDGTVQTATGEQCDDGNTTPDDGCSATCQHEARLVINEVDYDQTGTDATEFIEIYNAGDADAVLAEYAVVLYNGGTIPASQYVRFNLSDAGVTNLAPGEYLLIAPILVGAPAGTARITPVALTNIVQNGSPDGVGLFHNGSLIDALSYEGEITTTGGDFGSVSLVEGTAATAADEGTFADSLVRSPNGSDTDNAAADWALAAPSPGAAN